MNLSEVFSLSLVSSGSSITARVLTELNASRGLCLQLLSESLSADQSVALATTSLLSVRFGGDSKRHKVSLADELERRWGLHLP